MNNATMLTDEEAEEVFQLELLCFVPVPQAAAQAGMTGHQVVEMLKSEATLLQASYLEEAYYWARGPEATKWADAYDRKAAGAARPVARVVPVVTEEVDNVLRVQFGTQPRPA
jgi:hypothetical protein